MWILFLLLLATNGHSCVCFNIFIITQNAATLTKNIVATYRKDLVTAFMSIVFRSGQGVEKNTVEWFTDGSVDKTVVETSLKEIKVYSCLKNYWSCVTVEIDLVFAPSIHDIYLKKKRKIREQVS